MLVPLAVPSGVESRSLLMHLLNPDRQQAGSYKGRSVSPRVNRHIAIPKAENNNNACASS